MITEEEWKSLNVGDVIHYVNKNDYSLLSGEILWMYLYGYTIRGNKENLEIHMFEPNLFVDILKAKECQKLLIDSRVKNLNNEIEYIKEKIKQLESLENGK